MSLGRYFRLGDRAESAGAFLRRIRNGSRSANAVLDRVIQPVDFEDVRRLPPLEAGYLHLESDCLRPWVKEYFPDWRDRLGDLRHRKLVEFFTSFTVLETRTEDIVMDAAGGYDTYLTQLGCRTKYLQDIRISPELKARLGRTVEYIEGDAGDIPLGDESVDKVSCHHSFEHFQGDSDTSFVKEIQRLLKPQGKCCIVPIFVANHYIEVTNELNLDRKFDPRSSLIVDLTAALPGGDQSGHYARVYDVRAFQERVLAQIDSTRFKSRLLELRLDDAPVPDLTLRCHKRVSAINRPMRALVIERLR
jgi:predicted SAM-dependent methyltransferase